MSMMVSFVLSFFPRDVLDEILNLIESVSEDFPSYSYIYLFGTKTRKWISDHVKSKSNSVFQYSKAGASQSDSF